MLHEDDSVVVILKDMGIMERMYISCWLNLQIYRLNKGKWFLTANLIYRAMCSQDVMFLIIAIEFNKIFSYFSFVSRYVSDPNVIK